MVNFLLNNTFSPKTHTKANINWCTIYWINNNNNNIFNPQIQYMMYCRIILSLSCVYLLYRLREFVKFSSQTNCCVQSVALFLLPNNFFFTLINLLGLNGLNRCVLVEFEFIILITGPKSDTSLAVADDTDYTTAATILVPVLVVIIILCAVMTRCIYVRRWVQL